MPWYMHSINISYAGTLYYNGIGNGVNVALVFSEGNNYYSLSNCGIIILSYS